MPTLSIDVDAEPWSVDSTLSLGRSLGLPAPEACEASSSVAFLSWPRRTPSEIPQPLSIGLIGKSPASLLTYSRGFDPHAVTDWIVSPELDAILQGFTLPPHERMAVEGEIFTRGRGQRHAFVWLWWTVPWGRVRFEASTFERHDRDGSVEEIRFDCYEDYEQVRARSVRTSIALLPSVLAYKDDAPAAADLDPRQGERWNVSDALADRIESARLPGVRVDRS